MPVRISASTVAFPGLPLARLPERAAALALDGLALTVAQNGSMRLDASQAEIEDFRSRCRDAGIRISALYGYAGRGMLADAAGRAADIDLARRCIDLAARLEAPLCRIFAGSDPPTGDLVTRFVEACGPVADHAAAAHVLLGFPTHHDLAYDPASCRRLVAGLGRDRAGIVFNGPSMELDGISPVAALHEMRDLVVQVELKDWRREDGHAAPTTIGEGQATVWPIVEALGAIAFDGWVTVHHLKQHHPEMPDLGRQTVEALRGAIGFDGPTGPRAVE